MAFKEYKKGDLINIVRGPFKGNSATVQSMDPETGRLEVVGADGSSMNIAQGLVTRVKEKEEVAPELTPEVIEEVKEEVKASKEVKLKVCPCGCGELANKGREFRSGHDQRHKGNLIRAMQAGSVEAETELRRRGWRKDYEIQELKKKAAKPQVDRAKLEELAKGL